MFRAAFVVQALNHSYEVQAEYGRRFDCEATGQEDGEACEECAGMGFAHDPGVEYDSMSPEGGDHASRESDRSAVARGL